MKDAQFRKPSPWVTSIYFQLMIAFLSFIARLNSPDHFFEVFGGVQEILQASLFTSLGLGFRITLSQLIVFIISLNFFKRDRILLFILVSKYYGFGLMNAELMTTFAKSWVSVPEQLSCEIKYTINGQVAVSHHLNVIFYVKLHKCTQVSW